MVYDEKLAERIKKMLGRNKHVAEKKMFGGLSFLLDGKMFCGVLKSDLVLRIKPESYEETLAKPHVRPMDFTGKPIRGFIFVSDAGIRNDKYLLQWISLSLNYAKSLPAKKRKSKR